MKNLFYEAGKHSSTSSLLESYRCDHKESIRASVTVLEHGSVIVRRALDAEGGMQEHKAQTLVQQHVLDHQEVADGKHLKMSSTTNFQSTFSFLLLCNDV
jgi:hypothetical protein